MRSANNSPVKDIITTIVPRSPMAFVLFVIMATTILFLALQDLSLSRKLEIVSNEVSVLLSKHSEQKALIEAAELSEQENVILQQKVAELTRQKDSLGWRNKLALESYNFSKPFHRIHSGDPNNWNQQTFMPHGHYSFVQFSGHRLSPSRIGITGMVYTKAMKFQEVKGCSWNSLDGRRIAGKLKFVIDESGAYSYTSQMMWCDLQNATGNNGGYLLGFMNNEEIVLYKEDPGQVQNSTLPEFEISYCSAPLYGAADSENIKLWFDYHRKYVGVNYFVLYNVTSVNGDLLTKLQKYNNEGSLGVVNMGDIASFNFHLFGQVIALNDCVFSLALRTKWLLLHDLDEFLYAAPPNTMFGLLNQYKDKTWLTHGCSKWEPTQCIRESDSSGNRTVTAVERMVFRAPRFVCDEKILPALGEEMCLHWTGHRKIILQPSKVLFTHVHEVRQYRGPGVNLNARTELVHHHFRGLNVRKGAKKCQSVYPRNVTDGMFVDQGRLRVDFAIANLLQSMRS